jgi:Bacterial Ig domain/Carboxypeptidase regulatory-like domain/Abnormal spindle-like microcephaly-assoc'd, ASPM-SPD-2-Hydin
VLTINGKQYLFLMLEYIPRTTSLNWAASIVKANPDKEVIVVTHSYMFYDNTRVDPCDTQDLGGTDNNGELVWSSFARKYPNVIMVVSGHITTGLAGRRADLGVSGNLVNQMLSNYQVLPNGGDGWLRILDFHPSGNTISVQTYSPYLNLSKTDSANQFTIYYHNPGSSGTGLGNLSGRVRNSTCQNLSGLTVTAGGHSAVTDSNGKFAFSSLPTGQTYTVSVSGSGWKSASKTGGVSDNLAASPTPVDFFLASSSTAACTPGPLNPSVTICSPAANAVVNSPVRVTASTTDSKTVRFVEIWADGAKLYHALGGSLDTSVTLAAGLHQVTVQGYDGIGFIRKTISITVTSNPTVTVSPSSLSFAAQNVGSASPAQTVQVTNNNTGAAATLSSVAASGDFAQSNNCGSSIAAGASCAVSVTFTPAATGTRSGTLTLTDSASNSPQTVSLSGTGGTASSCTASTVNQTVTICTPTNGQTVSSPVHIVAKTTDSTPVQRLEVWVDAVKVYQVSGGSLTADVPIAAGVNHRLTVQAYDGSLTPFKTTISITVN